jgi:Uncharacterized protein conserved in bacteria
VHRSADVRTTKRAAVNIESYMAKNPIYKVIFYNQNQVYEVYARAIYQSDMYGFIELEEFVFGERSQVLVDPAEEKLKSEFAAVKRSYIPLHAIIRIDEVEKEGAVRVTEVKSGEKVTPIPFPTMIPTPKGE